MMDAEPWIFLTLVASWILKNVTQPTPITTWDEFVLRSAIGPISGEIVIGVMGVFMLALLGIGMATIPLRHSVGKVFDYTRFDQLIRDRATNRVGALTENK